MHSLNGHRHDLHVFEAEKKHVLSLIPCSCLQAVVIGYDVFKATFFAVKKILRKQFHQKITNFLDNV